MLLCSQPTVLGDINIITPHFYLLEHLLKAPQWTDLQLGLPCIEMCTWTGTRLSHRWTPPDCKLRQLSKSTITNVTVADIWMHLPTICDQAFPAAATHTWNGLPLYVISAPLLPTFKAYLQTYFFWLSFPWLQSAYTKIFAIPDMVNIHFFITATVNHCIHKQNNKIIYSYLS